MQRIEDVIKATFPDFKIAWKDTPATMSPWERFVCRLGRIFVPGFAGMTTTIRHTVVFDGAKPDKSALEWLETTPSYTTTLKHEFVHMRDADQSPIWFFLSYLFVLPVLWTWRAKWEMRGYSQNLVQHYRRHGCIDEAKVQRTIDIFCGSHYLWMATRKLADRMVREVVRDIESNQIKDDYYPHEPPPAAFR